MSFLCSTTRLRTGDMSLLQFGMRLFAAGRVERGHYMKAQWQKTCTFGRPTVFVGCEHITANFQRRNIHSGAKVGGESYKELRRNTFTQSSRIV